jgi:hypothetical protein
MQERANRTLGCVIFDDLWPYQGISPNPEATLRHSAVATVLERLPEDAYAKLAANADEFLWFIPEASVGAVLTPFPCTMPGEKSRLPQAKALYLGPVLERRSTTSKSATRAADC